jgi:hypothetical protein
MTTDSLPSPELLRKLLRYEPHTGKLFWCERPPSMFSRLNSCKTWNTKYAGKEAFSYLDVHGYLTGGLFGKGYKAHRIIWAIQTGEWPRDQIDHIDRDKTNNRWANLREANNGQNAANRAALSKRTSAYVGVSWCATYRKWRAGVCKDSNRYGGYFATELEAAQAYDIWAEALHGDFARLNFPA